MTKLRLSVDSIPMKAVTYGLTSASVAAKAEKNGAPLLEDVS